ncbi:MAG: tetratricopeptide repeat protein [Myxococcota bacterium]
MRAVLCGMSIGLLMGAACGGVMSQLPVPLAYQVGVPLATAAGITGLLWLRALVRGLVRRLRERLALRRARKQRRSEVARARGIARQEPGARPVYRQGLVHDEVTVPLDGPARGVPNVDAAGLLRDGARAAEAGAFQDAIDAYTALLDADPDHYDARLARGRLLVDMGDHGAAMSDLVTAEELAPDRADPLVAIGDLHFARKDYVRAIECYDIALSLAPDHAMAWCRRGLSHLYRTSLELALADLEHALALDPDIPNLATHVALTRRKVAALKTPGRSARGRRR